MELKIIKSNRKSCELRILSNGILQIKVPLYFTKTMIDQVIEKKHDWIVKQKALQNRSHPVEKKYQMGGLVMLWGQSYTIEQSVDGYEGIDSEQLKIWVTPKNNIENSGFEMKAVLLNLLIKEFNQALMSKIEYYTQIMDVKVNQVRIKAQNTRWGSCSSKKNVNFNFKLVMAPPEILDYIIVHELAHLIEMNHSKQFWNHVEHLIPDYKSARKWLKTHGHRLNFDFDFPIE